VDIAVDTTLVCDSGFAAQFQLAAAEWIQAAATYNFTVPVLITGKLIGTTHIKQEKVRSLTPHLYSRLQRMLPVRLCEPRLDLFL
jgi:hypothetical protein